MIAYRSASMFMIFLIIAMPFYATDVFASSGSLSELSHSGDDGFDKVLAPTDHLNILVMATMKDNFGQSMTVKGGDLRLEYDGHEFTFSSCVDTGDFNFQCSYLSDLMDWTNGKHNMEIKLFDEYFVRLDMISDAFYVDGAAPLINTFDFDSQANDDFDVTYSVKDVACDGCGSYTSGLDKIEFTIDDNVIETITDMNSSTASGTVTISPQGLEQGTLQLCIIVYDLFGNSNTRCKGLYVDYSPPGFDSGSFRFTDLAGAAIEYSGPLPIDAIISINITEEESELGTVLGDFSALNTIAPDRYRGIEPSCQQSGTTHICSWSIMVDGVDGEAGIQMNASDSAGNINYFTRNLNLPMDASGPVVTSIDSAGTAVDDEKFLNNEENTIILEIDEAESGMDKMGAYLDLHYLNSGYGDVQADNCTRSAGFWYCSWNGIRVAGKPNGAELTVNVVSVKDDVGNNWDQDNSETSEKFTYDSEVPVFLNITISPLGSDLEILREDDIAEIVAYIKEEHSGLGPENVLADYSDFDDAENYTNARSCEQDNESIWRCEWEYSGNLNGGKDVVLNIKTTDNAGNEKDSADDHVYGKVFVAGVSEKEVDFWESVEVYDINKLNRNFLLSSSGTYIRAGFRLVAKAGTPYVHGFEITSCEGTLIIPDKDEVYEGYTIKDQFYYPDIERSDKYLLINIPNYDKSNVGNATGVKIICYGEVIQSKNSRSDVYSPNEEVNATINIKLIKALFEKPGLAAVDKITEKKSLLKKINWWIKNIDFWVDMLRPFCSLFNLIRQVLAGVCTLWKGVSYMFLGGQSNECFLQFDLLDRLWYGEGDRDATTGQWKVESEAWVSSKGFVSVGFWCDLVLCEDCGKIWKEDMLKGLLGVDIDSFTDGMVWWDKDQEYRKQPTWQDQTGLDKSLRRGTYMPAANFDPQKSLVVAVLCFPPCLPGILTKLQVYKQILITYNVCMNTAAVRGTDTSECDDYYSSQVCQQILGEFWYLIDDFLKDYLTKMALWAFEEKLLRAQFCKNAGSGIPGADEKCMVDRVYRIVGWFLVLAETIDSIESIGDHKWFKGNDKESEKKAQDHVNGELDK